MMYAFLAHVFGLCGGFLAKKRGIPAGALLGAIAFVFAFNLISGIEPDYPPNLRFAIQIFSGVLLGVSFTRADLYILRRLIKPALIIISMFLVLNIIFTIILARFTTLETTTAMLASAPGGIFDMAIFAIDFGADSQHVAILQVFRFIVSVMLFPIIVLRILRRAHPQPEPEEKVDVPAQPFDANGKPGLTARQKAARLLITMLCAAAGSILFRWLGIPAGGILGAVSGTALISAGAQKAFFPQSWKPLVQALAGGFVGTRLTRATLLAFGELILPMAIIIVQLLLMAFLTAWAVQRFTGMDRAHSLFSCVPGGVAEMGIIAGELGLRVPEIVLLHIIRLIATIFLTPLLLSLFLFFT